MRLDIGLPLALLVLMASPARADPFGILLQSYTPISLIHTSSHPIEDSLVDGSSSGTARAGWTSLGAESIGIGGQPPHDRLGFRARADTIIDDFVITGPGGVLTVTYNMILEGTLSAHRAVSEVGVGNTHMGGVLTLCHSTDPRDLCSPGLEGLGVLASINSPTVDAFLTSEPFTVALNQPFELDFDLNTDVLATGTMGSGTANFMNSLRFPTGPIFNLPDGYSASSVSAGIVGNRLAPVPEPSTFWLLTIGLAARQRLTRRMMSAARKCRRQTAPGPGASVV